VAEGRGKFFECVEEEARGEERREVGGGRGIGEEEMNLREVEDEREAVRRGSRVKREVSGASLEDGEQGNDHERARQQADGDERLRRKAKREDEVSEAVGEEVEMREGEKGVIEV
jgi:hypothetical protein